MEHSKDVKSGGEDAAETLGLAWWKWGHLTVRATIAVHLFDETVEVMASRCASPQCTVSLDLSTATAPKSAHGILLCTCFPNPREYFARPGALWIAAF